MVAVAWNVFCLQPAMTTMQPSGSEYLMAQDSPRGAPARDPNIAVQEELDIARRNNTSEAYDLFIARHPAHALAEIARRERDRLFPKRPPSSKQEDR